MTNTGKLQGSCSFSKGKISAAFPPPPKLHIAKLILILCYKAFINREYYNTFYNETNSWLQSCAFPFRFCFYTTLPLCYLLGEG